MLDKKLVSLVKKEMKKGLSESGIYDKLTRDGFSRHEVVSAIDFVNKENQVEGEAKKGDIMQTVLIVVGMVVLFGAIYYLFFYSAPASPDKMTTDSAVLDKNTASIDDYPAFEDSFMACRPDEYTSSVIDGSEYYYRIIGPSDGLCMVESMFMQNPDSSLVDINMSCLYDNTLGFEDAIQDTSRCSGRLFNLMVGYPDDSPMTCDMPCADCRLNKLVKSEDGACVECRQDSDCNEGFECFSDSTCINRQIISVSPPCTDMSCLDYPCEDCRTGYRICQGSTLDYKNNKCVECGVDAHCKAGFVCREYKCVEE